MSILKPKDGDYISRGILLLLGWFIFAWLPFAFLGGVISALVFGPSAGLPGATIFFVLAIPLGVWMYSRFLDWSFKNRP